MSKYLGRLSDRSVVVGEYKEAPTVLADGERGELQADLQGNIKTTLATQLAGENLSADVLHVRQNDSYQQVASDTAIKTGPGFLHTLTFVCNDAAPTAGTIDVYDNIAGSGTKIFSWTLTTTPFVPVTVILDVEFNTGLYIDFTTTADVNVIASFS